MVREFATSHDGAKVPLNIIRRKGTKLDGSNPVLLIAYGYGISLPCLYGGCELRSRRLRCSRQVNRDVRPPVGHSYTCHGPDEGKRQSKLRLGVEAIAKNDLRGHFAIVPGNPGASELLRRVGSTDDRDR